MRLIFWRLGAILTIAIMRPSILFAALPYTLGPCSVRIFWSGDTVSTGHNVVTTAALRSPWTRTPFALEQLLQDVPDSHVFYKQKSTMQTDAWKSHFGLPSSPYFVPHEQPLCYSFFRKISEVTINTVQLLLGRIKSCCNSRVSLMLREERPFCAAFLSRTVVALWDSPAT